MSGEGFGLIFQKSRIQNLDKTSFTIKDFDLTMIRGRMGLLLENGTLVLVGSVNKVIFLYYNVRQLWSG